MPKMGRFYEEVLNFSCESELRENLVALAYLRGDAGSYAQVTRTLLREAVKEKIAQMDPDERRDFKKILESVRTRTLVSRMERDGRRTKKGLFEPLPPPDPPE